MLTSSAIPIGVDPARVDPDEFTRLSKVGPGGTRLSDCVEDGEEGRACSKSGDRWKCTACDEERTECIEGLYDGWDACRSNCLDDLCSKNTDEDGIRYYICPR